MSDTEGMVHTYEDIFPNERSKGSQGPMTFGQIANEVKRMALEKLEAEHQHRHDIPVEWGTEKMVTVGGANYEEYKAVTKLRCACGSEVVR